MASVKKFSYHRLTQKRRFDEEAEEERAFRRIRNFARVKKFTIRKRIKLRILGLRRLLRKRAKFFFRVKVSWRRALRRLKNGQAHMNDLFGGNFLVMQANPTPFKCCEKRFMAHSLHSLPPKYPLGRISRRVFESNLHADVAIQI